MIFVAVLLVASAHGQSIDAFGAANWPGDGDPVTPMRVTAPTRLPPGSAAGGLHVDYLHAPLVRYLSGSDGVDRETLVGQALSARLAGTWSVHPRLVLAADLPLRTTLSGEPHGSGAGLGDASVWASVPVISPPHPSRGVAVAAAPFVTVPTGATARYAGAGAVRGGAVIAADWRTPVFALTGEAGASTEPGVPDMHLSAAPSLRGGIAGTWTPTPALGIGLEARGSLPVSRTGRDERGVAAEILASARARTPGGLWAGAGISHSASNGVGMAQWGAFVRVGATLGALEPPVPHPVGIVVRTAEGMPVRGAEVVVGDRLVDRTDAWGHAEVAADARGQTVRVSAPGLDTAEFERPGDGVVDLTLDWAPVPLQLQVTDRRGAAVDATVDLPGAEAEVEEGTWSYLLDPGRWTLTVSAPGMGSQVRTVQVPRGRTTPIRIEAVLAPAAGEASVRVVVDDPEGRHVEGAVVLVNGAPVGTTATGGDVTLTALADAEHTVRASKDGRVEAPEQTIAPAVDGISEVQTSVGYAAGTVRIVARGPEEAAVSGLVQIRGPTSLPPMPLDDRGERLVVLPRGTWVALVSSPALGMQERVIEVDEDSPRPLVVAYTLQPDLRGTADLVVRVRDRSGVPVDGADVLVDDRPYGSTASAGVLRLRDFPVGSHVIRVRKDGRHRPDDVRVDLLDGVQEVPVVLDWPGGTLQVRARTGVSEPVSAVVRLSGPVGSRTGTLDDGGQQTFYDLAPGEWEVMLSSVDHGMQTRAVTIPSVPGELPVAHFVLGARRGNGSLSITVADPDGAPVDGAWVSVDGERLGRTANGGRVGIGGLRVGSRQVAASGVGVACDPIRVAVIPTRPGHADLACRWGTGALDVVVRTEEGPVGDALLRVSGPESASTLPVSAAGTRRLTVAPGTWRVLVSSPSAGLAEQIVEVGQGRPGLRRVEFVLDPESPEVRLLVRLVDTAGRPAPNASVLIDGELAGYTDVGGTLLVQGLEPGEVEISVEDPAYEPVAPMHRTVKAGANEQLVELHWRPVLVAVRITDADRRPIVARVNAVGPDWLPADVIDGQGILSLAPGSWQVVASAEGMASVRLPITIEAGVPAESLDFTLRPARLESVAGFFRVRGIRFEPGSDQPPPEADATLEEIASLALGNPDLIKLEVQGHTDDVGGLPMNLDLSQRRAEAIRQALLERGVPPDRLVARGYGPTRPVATNEDPAGRAANRRAELHVLELAEGAANPMVDVP